MNNSEKIILHLCASEYGSDTRDYREAGYDVRLITKDIDVRTYTPPANVYGIIANPPCTMFSSARMTPKEPRNLRQGMELVIACLKIIWECQYETLTPNGRKTPLRFWVLENPAKGMLRLFLGKPAFIYQPWQFGDDMSKETAMWGNFNEPPRLILNQRSHNQLAMKHGSGKGDSDLRSIASPYFTKAFYIANP